MSNEISALSRSLGMSESEILNSLGLAKAGSLDPANTPGNVRPLRGLVEDQLTMYSWRGIKEGKWFIEDRVLRDCERKTPIISIIINTRNRELRRFAEPSTDDDDPGFRIRMKDRDGHPSRADRKRIDEATEWFLNTGRTDFEGADEREDKLVDVISQMAREYYTIDKVAIELQRDKKDRVVAFWLQDGATIKRVYSDTGYMGGRSDFDPRCFIANDEFIKKIENERLAMVPTDMREIAFVQEINSRLTAAFRHKDLIFDFMNKRVDLLYRGYGYSNTEQAMNVISAFLYALAYNASAFNQGALPKIAIAFKNGGFSSEQMASLQDEWFSNFKGAYGAWRVPFFNGEIQAVDLFKSSREMEYQKYLEFTACLIAAIFGFDLMESGLKFFANSNVLNESQDARQKFSKDRGLIDILGKLQVIFTRILNEVEEWKDLQFHFTGITPTDRENEAKLREMRSRTYMTIDEIRAEADMKPLPDGKGEVILNSVFVQFLQNQQMAAQQEGGEEEGGVEGEGGEGFDEGEYDEGEGEDEGGFSDEDVDEITDEAMSGFMKAKSKARTMLI